MTPSNLRAERSRLLRLKVAISDARCSAFDRGESHIVTWAVYRISHRFRHGFPALRGGRAVLARVGGEWVDIRQLHPDNRRTDRIAREDWDRIVIGLVDLRSGCCLTISEARIAPIEQNRVDPTRAKEPCLFKDSEMGPNGPLRWFRPDYSIGQSSDSECHFA